MVHYWVMNMMIRRSELFHIMGEICKELRKKFENDYQNCSIREKIVCWQTVRPAEEDDEEQGIHKLSTKRYDDDDSSQFSYRTTAGIKIGFEQIQVTTKEIDTYKNIEVFYMSALSEGKQSVIRTKLYWFDYLRPSVISLLIFLEWTRKVKVKQRSLALEKHLAKIIPDRVDNILLGGNDEK